MDENIIEYCEGIKLNYSVVQWLRVSIVSSQDAHISPNSTDNRLRRISENDKELFIKWSTTNGDGFEYTRACKEAQYHLTTLLCPLSSTSQLNAIDSHGLSSLAWYCSLPIHMHVTRSSISPFTSPHVGSQSKYAPLVPHCSQALHIIVWSMTNHLMHNINTYITCL